MSERLAGKVALVTGASRGIGRAIALRFAAEGASVAVHYRAKAVLAERVCEMIVAASGSAISVQGDLGDADAIPTFVDKVKRHFRQIDILVNNAGIVLPALFAEPSLAVIERLMKINVYGLIAVSGAVIPGMIERRYGKIINISSIAALGTRVEGISGYAATKAAVIAVTKRTAFELGRHNINVNAIAPGLIRTDMGMPETDLEEREAKEKSFSENSVLGRIGEPDDIAHAAVFLASDEASFITGQVFVVDGGRTNYLTHSA